MKNIIIISMLCFLVLGCKQRAPECSTRETKELVASLVKDQVINGFVDIETIKWLGGNSEQIEKHKNDMIKLLKEQNGIDLNNITVTLDAIRTIKIDDKTGSCLCKAEAIINGLPNKIEPISIQYLTELVDNTNEFVVTLY